MAAGTRCQTVPSSPAPRIARDPYSRPLCRPRSYTVYEYGPKHRAIGCVRGHVSRWVVFLLAFPGRVMVVVCDNRKRAPAHPAGAPKISARPPHPTRGTTFDFDTH
jgi:hypothetical protein